MKAFWFCYGLMQHVMGFSCPVSKSFVKKLSGLTLMIISVLICVDTFFFSIFRITKKYLVCFAVQSLSHVRLFVTPWTAAHQASRSITNFWSLLKLMSIELVMPSNHLILCRPLLLLPSIFCSIRVISNESVLELVNRHMGSEGGSMDQGQSLGIVRCR